MLCYWINGRHQKCIGLIFICHRPSMAWGKDIPTLVKLWIALRTLCASNDEIMFLCYHLGSNIWKLSKLLMTNPNLLCYAYIFLLLVYLFPSWISSSKVALLDNMILIKKMKHPNIGNLLLHLFNLFSFKNRSVENWWSNKVIN
jgi:hypothetical protein